MHFYPHLMYAHQGTTESKRLNRRIGSSWKHFSRQWMAKGHYLTNGPPHQNGEGSTFTVDDRRKDSEEQGRRRIEGQKDRATAPGTIVLDLHGKISLKADGSTYERWSVSSAGLMTEIGSGAIVLMDPPPFHRPHLVPFLPVYPGSVANEAQVDLNTVVNKTSVR